MRPGELLPGDGPAPAAPVSRRTTVRIANRGRFPAYLGSHFPLVWASRALEFPREGLEGGRPDLPAGATVRIGSGEEIELDVVWG